MMRQAGHPYPVFHVVDPDGRVRRFKVSRNNNANFLDVQTRQDGTLDISIRGRLIREGYDSLEEMYKRDALGVAGYQAYCEYEAACLRNEVPARPQLVKNAQTGEREHRANVDQFPEELLPEELLLRRAGKSAVSNPVYSPPRRDDLLGGAVEDG